MAIPPNFHGVKGRSGRRMNYNHVIDKCNVRLEQSLLQAFMTVINKAIEVIPVKCPFCEKAFDIPGGGDVNAAYYLIDRRLGKARIQIDSNVIQASVSMTPADYARLSGELAKFRASIIDDTQLLCQSGETERKTEVIEAATEIAQCDDYAI